MLNEDQAFAVPCQSDVVWFEEYILVYEAKKVKLISSGLAAVAVECYLLPKSSGPREIEFCVWLPLSCNLHP